MEMSEANREAQPTSRRKGNGAQRNLSRAVYKNAATNVAINALVRIPAQVSGY
jgi:hypothetical protein